MCRLLLVKSKTKFNPAKYLTPFAQQVRTSPEYQGDGWGMAYWHEKKWNYYKHINSIWNDNVDQFPMTDYLLVHTRSAFQNEGIQVENNMPFWDTEHIFIFNGELQGVKVTSPGRIGAEKVFNYIKRLHKGNLQAAISKALEILEKRSKYIRAMNLMMVTTATKQVHVLSYYNESPDYFTLFEHEDDDTSIISSVPLSSEKNWQTMPNRSIREY